MLEGVCGGYNPRMARRDHRNPKVNAAGEREKPLSGESTFAWEFGGEAHTSNPTDSGRLREARAAAARTYQRPSPVRQNEPGTPALPRLTGGGDGRLITLRRHLDLALSNWWLAGDLPPLRLLREALMALEAGQPLDEAHRTLLLRTALASGRGIVTALKYQTDDERTILLLHEALVDWQPPLQAAYLMAVARAAERTWYDGLTRRLRYTMATAGAPFARANAAAALQQLGQRDDLIGDANGALDHRRIWLRRSLLVALVLVIAGAFWWRQGLTAPADMVAVPAGAYWLRGADDGENVPPTRVEIDGFYIDRNEVTNDDYRRCAATGVCSWPQSYDSATHQNYFVDPAFGDFPVIYVTHDDAAAYCAWRGKRLPTATEWQVAAGDGSGAGPLTYPWGETFAPQWANSAASGRGDTVVVGAYRPAGDSWLGIADLAGNVAEWTDTNGADGGQYAVKGGSFRSDADGLTTQHTELWSGATAADWLGFRCAATQPPGRW